MSSAEYERQRKYFPFYDFSIDESCAGKERFYELRAAATHTESRV